MSTTPNQAYMNAYQAFQTDNAEMIAAAAKVQADIAQIASDNSTYIGDLQALEKEIKSGADPSVILVRFMILLGASSSGATLEGQMNSQIGLAGDRMVLNSEITKVTGDLTNEINSNSQGYVVIDGGPVDVMSVSAMQMDTFLDEIGADPNLSHSSPYYNADLDPNNPNSAMDKNTQQLVIGEWVGIRKLFNITAGVDAGPNGPNADGFYTPKSGDTYYFDPTDSTKIYDFQEYQTLLNQQGSGGGDKGATLAGKIITDNQEAAQEATNTTNAGLNNKVKTYSALNQAINQGIAGIAQWVNTIEKTANSHMASGS